MDKVQTIQLNGEDDAVVVCIGSCIMGVRDCVFYCDDPEQGGIVTTTFCECICDNNEGRECPLFKKKRALLLNTNY